MKNFKALVFFVTFLVVTVGVFLALAVDYFGWNAVENTLLLLFALFMFFIGRYTTRIDMYNGAKVVLASQESDDRRERAGLNAMGNFINTLKGGASPIQQQQALPTGQIGGGNVNDADLSFEEADYVFVSDDAE